MTQAGLNVADGVFPDGSTQWRIDTERSTWVLPDWSIVDSPGYLYTRWGTGGRPEMELTPSVRTGARITDSRTYASGSEISVRVWRTWNEYNDLTELLDADSGLPVVRLAENLPGSITLAVDADWETPSKNPLSASYTGWHKLVGSIGTDADGPIRTGAYLTVHVLTSSNRWAPVAEGWISTITPEDARLRIECADGLSVLSRQGATLRRNYYEGRPRAKGDGSYASNELHGSLSNMASGGVVDTASMQWLVPQTWDKGDTIDGDATRPLNGYLPYASYGGHYEYARWTWHAPEAMVLRRISVHVRNTDSLTSTTSYIVAYGKNQLALSDTLTIGGTFEGWKNYDFSGMKVAEGDEVTIVLVGGSSVHLALWTGSVADDSPLAGKWTYGGDEYRSKCPDWDVVAYLYRRAEGTVMSGYVNVTNIVGWSGGLDDSSLVTPPENRFLYAYYTPEASRDEIMSDLVMSHEALPFIAGTTDAMLGVYRIGGGMMQQYVQRIADVMGDDGKRRTVTARGCAVMAIASGIRHERTDEPTLTVCRNASASGVPSGAVEFVSFSPRMTLKGRPSLAVVRGSWSGDEAMPMVVAVEAEGSSSARGLVIESVSTDSEASDVRSAMRQAWASLDSESLDSWEGSLVVPGFLPGLIERTGAHAGAGAVIAIYDERYGLSDYRVLVKEVRADYGKRTTELTVTSHSPTYASTVPDTAAAVQSAGDLSTGSGMLYRMQYARVVTQTALADVSTVEVATASGDWWECEDVSVGYTPTRAVVTARIRGDPSRSTDEDGRYAVARIRIGGETGTVLDIDPYRRPDLYDGQALIVQVDAPRSSP